MESPLKYSYCTDCSSSKYFSGIPTSERDCVQKCDSGYFMHYKFSDANGAYNYCVDNCKYDEGVILASEYEQNKNNLCLKIESVSGMYVAVQDKTNSSVRYLLSCPDGYFQSNPAKNDGKRF